MVQEGLKRWGRRLVGLIPVALGAVVVVLLLRSREGPAKVVAVEQGKVVRVLRAVAQDVVPRAVGFGVVEPGRIWRAVSQVEGRLLERSELLETGQAVAAGEVLVRIDPREYELAVQEVAASILSTDAEIARLEMQEANLEASQDIEQRSLELQKADLERARELLASATVSETEVDSKERDYLTQLARVRDLENSLRLIPVERAALEASRNASEARQSLLELDLSHTVIQAPFDCRIVGVEVEESQFVSRGEVLAEAHGIDVAEVVAQVPMDRLRHLLPEDVKLPAGEILPDDVVSQLGLRALVRLHAGDFTPEWIGRVDRFGGTLDPETRTTSVIVAVDDPYQKIEIGRRPPLIQGMFCEVELQGRPKPARILVPRVALHGDEVYLVVDGRLQRRAVKVAFTAQDFLCLDSGVTDGDVVVVSELVPAVAGMKLVPQEDVALQERLDQIARGVVDR